MASQLHTIQHGTRVKADGTPDTNFAVSPHCLKFTDLPYDILVKIFTALLPTEHNPSMDPSQPPTILTHISRYLREVALSTPTLWSSIDIPIYSADRFNPILRSHELRHKKGDVVFEWLLRRSARCDLDISLKESSKNYKSHHVTSETVVMAIHLSSKRWRKISLECSSVTFRRIMSLAANNSTSLPRLHSFRLLLEGGATNLPLHFNVAQDISLLRRTPLLQDVDLGTDFRSSYQRYNIDWSVLCHLSLGSYHSPVKASCASHIIRSAGQLRTCRLHLSMDDDKIPFGAPLLTSLSLSLSKAGESNWWKTDAAIDYFDGMSFPALTHIAYDSEISAPLVGLLTTKGPQITYLSISHMEGVSNLLTCLRLCPHVKELDIRCFNEINVIMREPISSFLNMLKPFKRTDQPDSETYCPELQYLALRRTITYNDIDDIIYQPQSKIKYTPLKGFYANGMDDISIRGDTFDLEDVQRRLELILQCRVECRPERTDPVKFPDWWPRPRDASIWWTV